MGMETIERGSDVADAVLRNAVRLPSLSFPLVNEHFHE